MSQPSKPLLERSCARSCSPHRLIAHKRQMLDGLIFFWQERKKIFKALLFFIAQLDVLNDYQKSVLFWIDNITAVKKKVQQRLHFLMVPRKNNWIKKTTADLLSITVSQYGTGAALRQTRGGSRRWSRQHRRLLAALFPPWWTSPSPAVSAEHRTSPRTALTPVLNCLNCCPLAGATDASKLELTKRNTLPES